MGAFNYARPRAETLQVVPRTTPTVLVGLQQHLQSRAREAQSEAAGPQRHRLSQSCKFSYRCRTTGLQTGSMANHSATGLPTLSKVRLQCRDKTKSTSTAQLTQGQCSGGAISPAEQDRDCKRWRAHRRLQHRGHMHAPGTAGSDRRQASPDLLMLADIYLHSRKRPPGPSPSIASSTWPPARLMSSITLFDRP